MVKIGIIGINKNNGHPYSYSSIINGFDPIFLKKYCPYISINKYLSKNKNKPFGNAKVTHIYTQNINTSKKIAKISNIPIILNNYKQLSKNVDCVILAKDDIQNNHKIITYFIKKNMPIFIDKQLASTFKRLKNIKNLINQRDKYLFFSGSCLKYSKKIKQIRSIIKKREIVSIEAFTKNNWINYSQHIFDPLIKYFNYNCKFKYAGISSNYMIQKKVFFKLNNKIDLIINLKKNCKKILIIFKLKNKKEYKIYLDDYYFSFKKTLQNFIKMIEKKKMMSTKKNIFFLSELVLQTFYNMQSIRK